MPTNAAAIIELPPDAATANDHRNPRRRRREDEEAPEVGHLVHPEPHHDLDGLVLHGAVRQDTAHAQASISAATVRTDSAAVKNQTGRTWFPGFGGHVLQQRELGLAELFAALDALGEICKIAAQQLLGNVG